MATPDCGIHLTSFAAADALLGSLPDGNARDVFRTLIAEIGIELAQDFVATRDAEDIVHRRARAISAVLERSWQLFGLDSTPHALAAVGGFGRGELHPGSDIDIAVVLAETHSEAESRTLEAWLTFLWDIGLEVGQSVRTAAECASAAAGDVTIATNLMEARLIAGASAPFEDMMRLTSPSAVWPADRFFEAKMAEQRARYRKYNDAFGQLEPNLKESPGGLRDIQVISWVANRHFRAACLHDLVTHGFLAEEEFAALDTGRRFLWSVRCALHLAAKRREDRLLFDHQRTVAGMLGYGGEGNLPIENFMRDFYRTVRELSSLNDMLLDLFQDAILGHADDIAVTPLNRRFQIRNGQIEVRDEHVFRRRPQALLELFLLMQQHPEIKGVRATTIRMIRSHLHLIDDAFRADIRSRSLFLEIIRQPRRIGHELQRMHRYGVLGAYLPVFARVSGLMQFDLFHVYTVDEHTLFLVRNMRRFSFPDNDNDQPPHCREAIERIPKLELLYVAGLFHDIAKGRGGDHSALGAEDAIAFCRDHGFSNYDTHLVAWLVRNHLMMSATAHRKDVYDVAVVREFARAVGDLVHLDYLYLLTVADIRATNPELWTSWKASLLSELYTGARRILRSGAQEPQDLELRIEAAKQEAKACLASRHTRVASGKLERFWATLRRDYFARHRPEEIAWHSEVMLGAEPDELPIVAIRDAPERGCTAIFVYAADMDNLFALTTAAIDRLRLDIQDARIITTEAGYTLDTFMVLEAESRRAIESDLRRREIQDRIRSALIARQLLPAVAPIGSRRRHRHFRITPTVQFSRDDANRRTVMEVIAVDQPGLLSAIGHVMEQCEVNLVDARIATFGERVEDYFYITDRRNRPFSDGVAQDRMRKLLIEALT